MEERNRRNNMGPVLAAAVRKQALAVVAVEIGSKQVEDETFSGAFEALAAEILVVRIS